MSALRLHPKGKLKGFGDWKDYSDMITADSIIMVNCENQNVFSYPAFKIKQVNGQEIKM